MRTDLSTSAGELRDAIEELQLAWRQANEKWNDAVSRSFCQEHLEPIGHAIKTALEGVDHMGQQLGQMCRECES